MALISWPVGVVRPAVAAAPTARAEKTGVDTGGLAGLLGPAEGATVHASTGADADTEAEAEAEAEADAKDVPVPAPPLVSN